MHNSVLILFDIKEIILGKSSFISSNIFKRKQSQIQNFSLPVRLIMLADQEVSFGPMEEQYLLI